MLLSMLHYLVTFNTKYIDKSTIGLHGLSISSTLAKYQNDKNLRSTPSIEIFTFKFFILKEKKNKFTLPIVNRIQLT